MASCDLWLADLTLHGAHLAKEARANHALDASALARVAKLGRSGKARDLAASYGLLWRALGRPPALGKRIRRSETGWPVVPGGPAFSLSRTSGWAAVAVTGAGGVGLDIEALSGPEPSLPILAEVADLCGAGAEASPLAAFTLLEAWVKLRGDRLAAALATPGSGRELREAAMRARLEGRLHPLGYADQFTGHLWTETVSTAPRIRFL